MHFVDGSTVPMTAIPRNGKRAFRNVENHRTLRGFSRKVRWIDELGSHRMTKLLLRISMNLEFRYRTICRLFENGDSVVWILDTNAVGNSIAING